MDDAPITDEEIDRYLAEELEVLRHRDAGTLLSPNMTQHLSATFNIDTSPAAQALLKVAIMFEWEVRETAAVWEGNGIASVLATQIVSAAEQGACTVDAEVTAFLRTFIAHGAAGLKHSGSDVIQVYPHKIIAELRVTKPDSNQSWDQLWAAACFKSWWGAAVQLEELGRRYGPTQPKLGRIVH